MSLPPLTPRTSDGKPVVLVNIFPGDVLMNYAGAGDAATPGSGPVFQIQRSTPGTEELEWGFCDWVYVAGGGLGWSGADLGDTLTMSVYAPATPTPGTSGTANCKRTSLGGGLYRIDPAAGEDASHVLDLGAGGNWVPVPAFDAAGLPNGKWDYSLQDVGLGSLAPAAVTDQGGCNLFEFPVTLQTFATKLPILGSAVTNITVPAIKIKKLFPRWRMKLALHVDGERTVKAAWWLLLGRKRTQ
jgi:hypothetical protein